MTALRRSWVAALVVVAVSGAAAGASLDLGRIFGAGKDLATAAGGLDEEDLKQATFNAGQMKLLGEYATTKDAAEQGARGAGLAPAKVDYLGGRP